MINDHTSNLPAPIPPSVDGELVAAAKLAENVLRWSAHQQDSDSGRCPHCQARVALTAAISRADSQAAAPKPNPVAEDLVGKIRAVFKQYPDESMANVSLGALIHWRLEKIECLLDAPQPASVERNIIHFGTACICGHTLVHHTNIYGDCHVSNCPCRHFTKAPSPSPTPATLPDNIVIQDGVRYRKTGEVRLPKKDESAIDRNGKVFKALFNLRYFDCPIVVRDDAGPSGKGGVNNV